MNGEEEEEEEDISCLKKDEHGSSTLISDSGQTKT